MKSLLSPLRCLEMMASEERSLARKLLQEFAFLGHPDRQGRMDNEMQIALDRLNDVLLAKDVKIATVNKVLQELGGDGSVDDQLDPFLRAPRKRARQVERKQKWKQATASHCAYQPAHNVNVQDVTRELAKGGKASLHLV